MNFVRLYAIYLIIFSIWIFMMTWNHMENQELKFHNVSRDEPKRELEIVNGESVDITSKTYLHARKWDKVQFELYYMFALPLYMIMLAIIYWQMYYSIRFKYICILTHLISAILLIGESYFPFICQRNKTCMPVPTVLQPLLHWNSLRRFARLLGTIEFIFFILNLLSITCCKDNNNNNITRKPRAFATLRSLSRAIYGTCMILFGLWSWIEPNSLCRLLWLRPPTHYAGIIDFRFKTYRIFQPGQRYPGNGPFQYIGYIMMHIGFLNLLASIMDVRRFFNVSSRMTWIWIIFYLILVFGLDAHPGILILAIWEFLCELPTFVQLIRPPQIVATTTENKKKQ